MTDNPVDPPPPRYGDDSFKSSYHLENKGRKWLQLFVNSRRKSALPILREGETISGHVELDLEKSETIKAITVEVQAGTTSVGQEEMTFLQISEVLWTSSKTSTKLSGKHTWPFNITLPHEVTVPKGSKSYKLPPSFNEKASMAYIDYRIVVTIKRGALRANQTLSTNFAYIPRIIPAPLSDLRRLAYSKSLPLSGPEADPEGWKVLPPVVLRGTLFDAQKVEVECTLAIATPVSHLISDFHFYKFLTSVGNYKLCYAPGSPLPLHLTLRSNNEMALDLLSTPDAIRLYLTRSMGIGADAHESTNVGRSNNTFVSSAGQAFFWSSGKKDDGKRELEGELEVSSSVKPSFIFPRFTIRYRLELLSFSATGFQASDLTNETVLLREEIVIGTQQAPGIVPRPNAPPGYKRPETVDYNATVGFLENGNQRFFHHGHGGGQ